MNLKIDRSHTGNGYQETHKEFVEAYSNSNVVRPTADSIHVNDKLPF